MYQDLDGSISPNMDVNVKNLSRGQNNSASNPNDNKVGTRPKGQHRGGRNRDSRGGYDAGLSSSVSGFNAGYSDNPRKFSKVRFISESDVKLMKNLSKR